MLWPAATHPKYTGRLPTMDPTNVFNVLLRFIAVQTNRQPIQIEAPSRAVIGLYQQSPASPVTPRVNPEERAILLLKPLTRGRWQVRTILRSYSTQIYWLKICEDMDKSTLEPKRGRQGRGVEQKQKAPVATNPFRMESLNLVSSEKILQYSLILTDQSSFMGVDPHFDLIQLNKYIFVAMEESIYNLVPRDLQAVAKPTLYKSKYPPTLIPTGSTFCHATTSKPLVANLAGEFAPGLQAHTEHGQTKTFGHLKGDRKPSPDNFIKKHTGTMGNETLPAVKDFAYDCSHKKEPVPKVDDKPVQGLRSGKNFIVSNAIENILSAAKQKPETIDYLTKKDFGKTPAYIEKIKENVTNQYKMIQQLHEQYDSQKQCLSEEEVRNIRNGLRRKWDEVNKEYQKNTHIRMVDTIGLKTRKENYEKELAEIEADIKKLNKLYIFVEE